MLTEDYRIKKIRFEDYDKYFRDLIDSPDDSHILFYKRDAQRFIISMSYDQFIIVAEISIEKIIAQYEQESPTGGQPIEVANDTTGDHPAIVKFMAEYLKRGIPEVD